MRTDYDIMNRQAAELVDGIPHFVANLANISALIFDTLEDINWAGFYLLKGDKLVLGPFQGKPACIEIPSGKGVCGTALASDSIQRIENVHEFKGHIACDSASNSEIVLPIHKRSVEKSGQEKSDNDDMPGLFDRRRQGEVIAVLDIDSTSFGRFSEEDEKGLAELVAILEEKVFTNLG